MSKDPLLVVMPQGLGLARAGELLPAEPLAGISIPPGPTGLVDAALTAVRRLAPGLGPMPADAAHPNRCHPATAAAGPARGRRVAVRLVPRLARGSVRARRRMARRLGGAGRHARARRRDGCGRVPRQPARLAGRTVVARAAEDDVVPRHRVAGAPLDVVQLALELVVGERLDLAAAVADEVVMVLAVGVDRFEARRARADVDALDVAGPRVSCSRIR